MTSILQCFILLKLKNEIDASLKKLLIGNQKCDAADITDHMDRGMIPMYLACFAWDKKEQLK